MAMTFRYKKIERPEPLGTSYAPSIPLTLINQDKSVDIVALVDSGADVSFIPFGIAQILDVDIKGPKSETIGVGGKIYTFETKIFIRVGNPHENYRFALTVKIPEKDNIDKFPVLIGRKDFFEHFDITFKEKEGKIILRKS